MFEIAQAGSGFAAKARDEQPDVVATVVTACEELINSITTFSNATAKKAFVGEMEEALALQLEATLADARAHDEALFVGSDGFQEEDVARHKAAWPGIITTASSRLSKALDAMVNAFNKCEGREKVGGLSCWLEAVRRAQLDNEATRITYRAQGLV